MTSTRMPAMQLQSFLENSACSQNRQVLNVSGTFLGSIELMGEVVSWISSNKPRFVFLDGCEIQDDGASILAEMLHHTPFLQFLSVRGNWITDIGAMQFADVFRSSSCNLQSINFIGNEIGDAVRDFVNSFESSRILRSICGLMQTNGELVVRNSMRQSDPYLIAGELRKSTDFRFLEINGRMDMEHVFNALEFNNSLVRFKCLDLVLSNHVTMAMCKAFTNNNSLKTFEMAMNSQQSQGGNNPMALQEIFHSIEMNRGLTTFAMEDFWMTQEACTSYSMMLKSNQTLQHLVFINNRMSLPEVSIIANGLERNSSVQCIRFCNNDISSSCLKILEDAARARSLPLTVRVNNEEYFFGPQHQRCEQWNVEDFVEGRFRGNTWMPARVMAVFRGDKYYLQYTDGQEEWSVASRDIRMGNSFERPFTLRASTRKDNPAYRVISWSQNNGSNSRQDGYYGGYNMSCDMNSEMMGNYGYNNHYNSRMGGNGNGASSSYNSGDMERFSGGGNGGYNRSNNMDNDYGYYSKCQQYIDRMPYLKPREMVECRFYGDRKWYAARVTKVYPSGLSDLRLEDGSQEHQMERHMVRKSGDGEFVDNNFDPGMYESNDLIEIKLAGTPWQRGQITSTGNDGTYSIHMESGIEEDNVAGRWLRHYFRQDQQIDGRRNGQIDYRDGVVMSQDSNGFYTVRFQDGHMEPMMNPRRMFPNGRRQIYMNALMFAMEQMGIQPQGPMSSKYAVGDRMECCARDGVTWRAGRISQMYGNDKYDVSYLEGNDDFGVPSSQIRMVGPGSGSPRSRGGARYRSPFNRVRFTDQNQNEGSFFDNDMNQRGRGRSQYWGGNNYNNNQMGNYGNGNYNFGEQGIVGFHNGDVYNKSYYMGMRVEARYHGHGSYHPGYICRINPDNTYDVSFDYNEIFPSIPAESIRPFFMGENFYGYMPNMSRKFDRDQGPMMNGNSFDGGFNGPFDHSRMNPDMMSMNGNGSNVGNGAMRRGSAQDILRKGLRVELQSQSQMSGTGKWMPGRIVHMYPQGTYDVMMEHGATETNVPRANIRVKNSSSHRNGGQMDPFREQFLYKPGMPVEAQCRGSSMYYPGFIHGCHADGSYDVCFEDGTTEMGLKRHMLKPAGYQDMMMERYQHSKNSGYSMMDGLSGRRSDKDVGYEYCSSYYGSMVYDGYGYDSMNRNSERNFRGHPKLTSGIPTETGFGVYYAREVLPDQWTPMMTYVYDAFQEYIFRYQWQSKNPGLDYRYGLNNESEPSTSAGFLPRGCEITIVPCSEWCDFSGGEPCMGRVVWNGWRVSCPFFYKPRQGAPRNFTMKVVFYVRAVMVSEVSLDVYYPQGVGSDSSMMGLRGPSPGRELRDGDMADGSYRSDMYPGGRHSGYVDVRTTMFRNIFMIQMDSDDGYELLMAETVEAVPGLTIRRHDGKSRMSMAFVRTSDRVQFICHKDGGRMSSEMNSDYRMLQSILTTPEERAQKMLLTFAELPMMFPQNVDRLPGCNFSFSPEVSIYRWQCQPNSRPLMDLRHRLYEAARTISRAFFDISDRPVPLGMLYLPVGNDYGVFNSYSSMNAPEGIESSMWNLFFMCEDHASQTMRDEFAHQPIEMRWDPKFIMDAYPLMKATVAVMMYCRLTYKENLPLFPTPFNAYGLSKRFDENMLVDMSNFYDEFVERSHNHYGVNNNNNNFSSRGNGNNGPYRNNMMGGGVGMGGGGGKYPNNNGTSLFGNTMNDQSMMNGTFSMDPMATLYSSPMKGNQTFSSQNQNPYVAGASGYATGDRQQQPNSFQKLSQSADFLTNAVFCAESAVASLQNWSHWKAARKVRARLDEIAPTWLQQCDMKPVELDLKVWWVSPMAYEDRWKFLHWMVRGPDAPTYVSPGPGGLGVLSLPTVTAGFSSVSTERGPMKDIASHLMGEVGIKDFSVANEVAMRLSQEGCETWDDVLHLDEIIGSKNNFEEVKFFLQDFGVPTVVASKIMAMIRSNRLSQGGVGTGNGNGGFY